MFLYQRRLWGGAQSHINRTVTKSRVEQGDLGIGRGREMGKPESRIPAGFPQSSSKICGVESSGSTGDHSRK
jgi:hypothetical protein